MKTNFIDTTIKSTIVHGCAKLCVVYGGGDIYAKTAAQKSHLWRNARLFMIFLS